MVFVRWPWSRPQQHITKTAQKLPEEYEQIVNLHSLDPYLWTRFGCYKLKHRHVTSGGGLVLLVSSFRVLLVADQSCLGMYNQTGIWGIGEPFLKISLTAHIMLKRLGGISGSNIKHMTARHRTIEKVNSIHFFNGWVIGISWENLVIT